MALTKQERKAALVLKGIRQSDIARATGFSAAYVNDVIAGHRRSDEIERAIARAIGRPTREVFGSEAA